MTRVEQGTRISSVARASLLPITPSASKRKRHVKMSSLPNHRVFPDLPRDSPFDEWRSNTGSPADACLQHEDERDARSRTAVIGEHPSERRDAAKNGATPGLSRAAKYFTRRATMLGCTGLFARRSEPDVELVAAVREARTLALRLGSRGSGGAARGSSSDAGDGSFRSRRTARRDRPGRRSGRGGR